MYPVWCLLKYLGIGERCIHLYPLIVPEYENLIILFLQDRVESPKGNSLENPFHQNYTF